MIRQRARRYRGWAALVLGGLIGGLVLGPFQASSRAEAKADKQGILGPGLYAFQTRVRQSTCGDAEPDGYVLSYVAAIDGVPGAITMSMQLVNTKHFVNWTLKVVDGRAVVGDARMGSAADAPDSHFEVVPDGARFTGTGFRTYNGAVNGKPQRCRVNYDALLRRIDL